MLLSSLFSWEHLHPILVHFTSALFPVSVVSDVFGKITDRYSLTPAAWWMLLYGAAATPFTALAGWMWANEIKRLSEGDPVSMLDVHQWLGTSLLFGFLVMAFWRGWIFVGNRKPGVIYFAFAALIIGALMYQGYLGGKMTMG